MKTLKFEVWFQPMKGGSAELIAMFAEELRADEYAAYRNSNHMRDQFYVAYAIDKQEVA